MNWEKNIIFDEHPVLDGQGDADSAGTKVRTGSPPTHIRLLSEAPAAKKRMSPPRTR